MEEIRDPHCHKCGLSNTCKTVCVSGSGNRTGGLLIVGEMPSWYDDEHNTVLGSPAAKMVEKIIQEVIGGDLSIVHKTYLIKCKTPESRKPSSDEIIACSEYLKKEIDIIRPKAILALGELVMQCLTGAKKINDFRGKSVIVDFGKGESKHTVKVISTFSPYYVDKVQSKFMDFCTDIMKAYNVAAGIAMSTGTKVVVCDTYEKIETAVEYCKQVGVCSFDFETPEIDEDKGTFLEGFKATCLSLSFQAGSAYVIPLEHSESPFSVEESKEIVAYIGKEIFENKAIRKIAQNINYDMHIGRIYGCMKYKGRLDDTMLMHHLYDETKKHGLKEIVSELFPEYAGYEDETKGYKWEDVPLPILLQYCGTDTDMTLRICTHLEAKLLEDERVYRIYRNLSMAALRPLWYCEVNGMLIDAEFLAAAIKEVEKLIRIQEVRLKEHSVVKRYITYKKETDNTAALRELTQKLVAIEEKKLAKMESLNKDLLTASERKSATIRKELEGIQNGTVMSVTEKNLRDKIQQLKTGEISAYKGFNFGSWQQLEDLLYDNEFGFRYVTFTRGTGKDILEDLNDETGFVDKLLLYKSLQKMYGTYLEGLWKRMDREKRVHTQLKIHGTVTGRLSSANPNLQNIPNIAKLKDETAIKVVEMIKKCFICPDGMTMLGADFSQAELRIIAEFANELTMLAAYADNQDLHSLLASKMLKILLDEFLALPKEKQKEPRTRAKAGNFGFIYGMGAKGFVDYAKKNYKVYLTEEEATAFRNLYFTSYPELLTYHEMQIAKAQKYGWVRTLYGRKRRTPEIHSSDDYKRSDDERIAINSPVQGTSGEFTIFGIALLYHRLDPRTQLAITVHDSTMFYIPDEILIESKRIILNTLENLPNTQYFCTDLKKVKMKVDVEATKANWKDLENFDSYIENLTK